MPLLSRRCCALVRLALGLAVLVLAPLAVASAAQEQRLLFIGNSLVYTGNLPAEIEYSDAGISMKETRDIWSAPFAFLLIAGLKAAELLADVKIARMGGLLHDLGKAVTHEIDGPHAVVGAEIAKRYGVPDVVVNCIASHHGEVEPESIEAVIVAAADAISGARPGARRESLETYIKRVTELEEIGNSFKGVSQTYAIQAGREIRVLVRPEDVDDYAAVQLSKNIAQKIEDNLQYPGQIRVTVVRETRAVEYAK